LSIVDFDALVISNCIYPLLPIATSPANRFPHWNDPPAGGSFHNARPSTAYCLLPIAWKKCCLISEAAFFYWL